MNFSSFASLFLAGAARLGIPFLAAFVPISLQGCGGVTQTVLEAKEADGGSTNSDAATSDVALPPPATCSTAQDCNDDPKVSSLLGTCENGKCSCQSPSVYAASGKCTRTPEVVQTQCKAAGGTCEGALGAPGDPPCKSNGIVLQSGGAASVGCNDAQHENCCVPTCNGKTLDQAGILCVRTTGGCAPPICLGTVFECPAGTTKSAPGGNCGL
ncbi:MAG: hypothetical protein U0174_09740 [Polyangiaceae bacterium]